MHVDLYLYDIGAIKHFCDWSFHNVPTFMVIDEQAKQADENVRGTE